MIVSSEKPCPGSVFSRTTMRGVTERFVSVSLRDDVPPCEYVEAEFGDLTAIVEDLGDYGDGRTRRTCHVQFNGVQTDFAKIEIEGSAPDRTRFGSRPICDLTIARIRRWAATHGMPDMGPARTPRDA